MPSFSGHNTLYKLLEASQKLTVLYCFLPTPAVSLLSILSFPISSSNSWPYGLIFHTHSMSYLFLFLCQHPSHLGFFLDPFDLLLNLVYLFLLFCVPYWGFLLSMLFSLLYLHIILSQTPFGHISINSLMILMVSMTMESPLQDLSIDTSHVSKRLIMAKILGRSTGNYHSTVY